jgi:hypothetical protein
MQSRLRFGSRCASTCLVAILKKEFQLPQSLHSILQILSVSTFEKVPLNPLLTATLPENYETADHNHLMLCDL